MQKDTGTSIESPLLIKEENSLLLDPGDYIIFFLIYGTPYIKVNLPNYSHILGSTQGGNGMTGNKVIYQNLHDAQIAKEAIENFKKPINGSLTRPSDF